MGLTAEQIDQILQLAVAAEPAIVDLIVRIRQNDGTVIDMSLLAAEADANLKQVQDWLAAHPKTPVQPS